MNLGGNHAPRCIAGTLSGILTREHGRVAPTGSKSDSDDVGGWCLANASAYMSHPMQAIECHIQQRSPP